MNTISSLGKKFFFSFLFLFACAIFGAMLIPSLISTTLGTSTVLKMINQQVNGEVKIQQVELGWFSSSQKFSNLQVYDAEKNPLLIVDQIEIPSSLLGLLWDRSIKFQFENLDLLLLSDQSRNSNLQNFLNPSIKLDKSNIHQTRLLGAKGFMSYTNQFLTLDLTGTTQNGEKGNFEVYVHLPELNQLSNETYLAQNQSDLKFYFKALDFPVIFIDEALTIKNQAWKGLALELLGENLDLESEKIPSNILLFKFDIQSPTFHSQLYTDLTRQRFQLTQPSHTTLLLNPSMWKNLKRAFNLKTNFEILAPTQAFLDIEKLSFEYEKNFKINFSTLVIDSSFKIDELTFNLNPKMQHLSLSKFETLVFSKGQSLAMDMKADFSHSSFSSPFTFQGQTQKFSDAQDLLLSLMTTSKVQIEFSKIPILFLDEIMGSDTLFNDILGPFAKLQLEAQPLSEKGLALNLELETDNLHIKNFQSQITDRTIVIQSDPFHYLLTNETIQKILHTRSIVLEKDISFFLDLDKAMIPHQKGLVDIEKSLISAHLHADQLKFEQLSLLGQIAFKNFVLKISGANLQNSLATLDAEIVHPHLILGKGGLVKIESALHFANHNLGVHEISAKFLSDVAEIATEIQLTPGFVQFTSPTKIAYQIEPNLLSQAGFSLNFRHMREPASISLVIQPPEKQTFAEILSSLKLSGLIAINHLVFEPHTAQKSVIEDLVIPWEVDAPANKISLNFTGKTTIGSSEKGNLEGVLYIKDWIENEKVNFKHSLVEAHLNLTSLPVAFLEAISGNPDLSILIGNSLNLALNTHFPLRHLERGDLEFKVRGEDLLASGSFKISENTILASPQPPLLASYTLTPERFDILKESYPHLGSLRLKNPSTIKISLADLSAPIALDRWTETKFTVSVDINKIRLSDVKTKHTLELENILAAVVSTKLENDVQFSFTAQEKDLKGNQAQISASGEIQDPLKQVKLFDIEKLKLKLKVDGQNLPLALLNQIFFSSTAIDQIVAVFGPTPSIHLEAAIHHFTGDINTQIDGSQGKANFTGTLNKGILTLQKDFTLEAALTPTLNTLIFEKNIPFLAGITRSSSPLSIFVAKEGFSASLREQNINSLHISGGRLDLGQVEFKAKSPLATTLSILHTQKMDKMTVWFTPLYFNVAQGTLNIERMDMLVLDRYPLAIWGKINFIKDKVKMFLGLSSTALAQAFNAQGLDKTFMLPLPISGTLKSASIDKKKATSHITSVVAKGKGAQGKLFGTFLDLTSGGYKAEPIPPSITIPLPWEGTENYQKMEKGEMKTDKSGLSIEKEAKNLFNSIFDN